MQGAARRGREFACCDGIPLPIYKVDNILLIPP
jgi:hypothetical protein